MKLMLMLTHYVLPDGTEIRPDNPDYFIEVDINKDNSERLCEIKEANLTPVFIGKIVPKYGLRRGKS